VAVISSVIFYLVRFRPTVKSNAKRLDSYGLDERIITMVELQGDDSFIAQRQRLDAEENLQKLDSSKIKFRFARPVIVLAIVFGFLFVGMSAVETLSEIDLIPSGKEVWQVIFPPAPPRQFSVVYTAGRGGYLVGEAEQSVVEGETSARVLAVGDEGFMFYMWSDGETNPSRADENVIKDLNISAIFIAVDDLSDPGGDEDEPTDVPGDEGQGPGGGEDPSESAGGKYIQVNQIIDGKTYYRDVYEEYYNLAKTEFSRMDLSDNPLIKPQHRIKYDIILDSSEEDLDSMESQIEIKKLENRITKLKQKNQKLTLKNQELTEKNKKLKRELKSTQDINNQLKNSKSWKITKPLRSMRK
jgi:cell division protein FtsB